MNKFKLALAIMLVAPGVSWSGSAAATAVQDDQVPMFCTIRAMGPGNMNYFVSGVFWGDYGNNLGYKNRFASWVNAEYGSMGGQYAAYCFFGDDENLAYQKRDDDISRERSGGSNVIVTSWGG